MKNKIISGIASAVLLSVVFSAYAAEKPSVSMYMYASPEAAVEALIGAIKINDTGKVLAVLGTTAKELASTEDVVTDEAIRATFIAAYDEKHAIAPYSDEKGDSGATEKKEQRILEIGAKSWPFPIPLVFDKKSERWFFDSKAGLEEITNRRIGRNELSAMEAALAYVDAQKEYYRMNPEKSTVAHFASKIASTPGKRDGLYWPAENGENTSPLGERMAKAAHGGEGRNTTKNEGDAYFGYRYRILTGQGPSASHGAYSYIEKNIMFGGFALVTYPDVYGETGIMTFLVNHDGILYEKDLGPGTAALAEKMSVFDPDKTWKAVQSSATE